MSPFILVGKDRSSVRSHKRLDCPQLLRAVKRGHIREISDEQARIRKIVGCKYC